MKVEQLRAAVATIFRRKGKHIMNEEEFLYEASIGLRWYTPSKAAIFLSNAKKFGLITANRDELRPSFDLDGDIEHIIKAPEELAEENQNPVVSIVDMICDRTGQPKSEVMSRVNRLKRELNLETQAAAVLIAAQHGIDVSPLAQAAADELLRSYRK